MVQPRSNRFSFGKCFKIHARTSSRSSWPGGRDHHGREHDVAMFGRPCARALPHVGRSRPNYGLAAASRHAAAHLTAALLATCLAGHGPLATSGHCCTVLLLPPPLLPLWHRAVLLLLASSPRARGLAPYCLAPSPCLNGAMATHAVLPNCLHVHMFSGYIVS